jgi:perosamine synthetase
MKKIPVSGPSITAKEIAYVADAAQNAWYENANVFHQRFEKAFAKFLGTRHALALPSCTSALHLSLAALDIGPGDEVVIPDVTWIASSAPITYVGATPVFADIEPDSWCLSAKSFESCITERTKAVIPVDLYGNMPDMDAIRAIADAHGIAVIEDAAEAIGSRYKDGNAGSFGRTGVFSFHGSKTLTTGEGGMLVTDDQALFDRICFLRDHGRTPGDVMFFNTEVGFKYKMSSMQAALGLAQLERIDELVAMKRANFAHYRVRLSGAAELTLNSEADRIRNTYWMVSAIFPRDPRFRKETVMKRLASAGVDSRPFFSPLSSLPAYRETPEAKAAARRNGVSYGLSPYGVNLPSGLNLTESMIDTVCATVEDILRNP